MPVHVLHIGKTAGTALKHALRPFADTGAIVLHKHPQRLRDCPPGEPVFFVVRDPADRFVSAFNSRLRRGRPRYDVPWTRAERLAFALFPTPNRLAEALGSRNPLARAAARFAMRGIRHVGTGFSYWLGDVDALSRRGGLIVGTTDTLAQDLDRLLAAAGIAGRALLPADPTDAHATPAGMSTELSAAARANLADWLAADMALYAQCLALARAGRDRAPDQPGSNRTDQRPESPDTDQP